MELAIPFLLEISSVQASKYGMVTEVYLSHICFKGHHDITIGVSRDLKDRMERYIEQVNPLRVLKYSFTLTLKEFII